MLLPMLGQEGALGANEKVLAGWHMPRVVRLAPLSLRPSDGWTGLSAASPICVVTGRMLLAQGAGEMAPVAA